jgi:hypothetical protein
MAEPRRTQKQIAGRYNDNLTYYRKIKWVRVARFFVSAILMAVAVAAIAVYQQRGPEKFFIAGPISRAHANFGNDCEKCHDPELIVDGSHTLERFRQVIKDRFHHGIPLQPLDNKCQSCHQQHSLHEPNVVQNRSCSVCHQEHKGAASMQAVASMQCTACHSDTHVMQASAAKGAQLPPSAFQIHPARPMQVVFQLPRPPAGFTSVLTSFWADHPEFQLKREKARDPDVLRFNHLRHFASDIPLLNGQRLDCISCHKADEEGRYKKRISFAANCQACHSLQFDPNNPELMLPHGDANAVRAFLRTLPTQYAQLAVKRGMVQQKEIQSFVVRELVRLRESRRPPEDLERDIFFTTSPYKPQQSTALQARGSFYGCAVCHEVKANGDAAPIVTKPILIDRWMTHAHFNHAKHASVKCDDCHHAAQSRETSDVLMPDKASCVACHSPQGKVVAECITCHTYHAPPQVAGNQAGVARLSLKQTLLAARDWAR